MSATCTTVVHRQNCSTREDLKCGWCREVVASAACSIMNFSCCALTQERHLQLIQVNLWLLSSSTKTSDNIVKQHHGLHYVLVLKLKENQVRETGFCLLQYRLFFNFETFWHVSKNSSIVTTPSLFLSIFWKYTEIQRLVSETNWAKVKRWVANMSNKSQ